jgi:hypothetical protein
VSNRDALKSRKRELELKIERTLLRIRYELSKLGHDTEELQLGHPVKVRHIESNSPVGRLMDREMPHLNDELTRVIAEIILE